MINPNNPSTSENTKELVVAGKIIASLLIAIAIGLLSFIAFNGIVISSVTTLLAGGLLTGLFFAPPEYRKIFALAFCLCVISGIVMSVLVRIDKESYASFFGYVGGLSCVFAVISLLLIIGLFVPSSNTSEAATDEGGGLTIVAIVTLVLSVMIWFMSTTVSKFLRPQALQVAEISPETEKEAQRKFLNSPEMLAAAEARRREEVQREEEKQEARMRQDSQRIENQRLEEQKKIAYFSDRAFKLSIALRQDNRISQYVRVAIYHDRGARFTVENSWHFLPYQERLQGAQNLGALWKKFAQTNQPDGDIFRIVDLNGNEVGGSGLLGVWVQKE